MLTIVDAVASCLRSRQSGAMWRSTVAVGIALGLTACTGVQWPLAAPAHLNGQVLWRIVHDQCVPDQQAHGQPSPCASVRLSEGIERGSAVLKDRVGMAQYLLIPTAKVTGIEDGALLQAAAPNYFSTAWDARTFALDRLRGEASPPQLSVAVNSAYGRSQDQLHLHIDCLRRDVAATLNALTLPPGGGWSSHTVRLAGHRYYVRPLTDAELRRESPFRRLADELPEARRNMGAWTIALTNNVQRTGSPGFWLLADHVDLRRGDRASSEELQDHDCR